MRKLEVFILLFAGFLIGIISLTIAIQTDAVTIKNEQIQINQGRR